MIDFLDLEKKLLNITKSETYTELAEKLGMTQPAYAGCRRRHSPPFKEILDYCLKHDINANMLFSTKKKKYNIISRRELTNYDKEHLHLIPYYTKPQQLTNEGATYSKLIILQKSKYTIPEDAFATGPFTDEMHPLITAASISIFQPTETADQTSVYLYRKNDTLHTRLFIKDIEDTRKVKLCSLSQIYQIESDILSDLEIFGKLFTVL